MEVDRACGLNGSPGLRGVGGQTPLFIAMTKQLDIFESPLKASEGRCEVRFCPKCGQRVRVWKKSIISTAVASLCRLVAMYRGEALHHDEFTVLLKDRNFSQLKLWGLVETAENRDPAKRASGKWHPTEKGIEFVAERRVVPKFVVTMNNVVERFEGPNIGVRGALGARFDYQELIRVNREEVAA
jgi:hypothetical protein